MSMDVGCERLERASKSERASNSERASKQRPQELEPLVLDPQLLSSPRPSAALRPPLLWRRR